MALDLTDFPEFRALQDLCNQLKEDVAELRNCQQQWVHTDEAARITGLSRNSLWRQRQLPDSLIQWKRDGGVRYLRTSLIAHNKSRAIGRGHLASLLPPTSPTPIQS